MHNLIALFIRCLVVCGLMIELVYYSCWYLLNWVKVCWLCEFVLNDESDI